MPLEPEDQRHLRAAEGYVELGMHLDASEELERIDPDVRHVPEVLAVPLQIYQALKKWELMQTVAAKLVEFAPDEEQWTISLAFATRRAQSIEAARTVLLGALQRFREVALIHYNLACYECQLGNMEEAKSRLSQAFSLDHRWRLHALEDEDLKPLWDLL